MTIAREPRIFRPSAMPAVDRGGGVKTIPLLTRRTVATSFINGMTIFPLGGSVPLHKHNCEESVLLVLCDIAGRHQ